MADASDLKSDDENREGSIPSSRTFLRNKMKNYQWGILTFSLTSQLILQLEEIQKQWTIDQIINEGRSNWIVIVRREK